MKSVDIKIENGVLSVKKDSYALSKIVSIGTKQMSISDQVIRVLGLGFVCSAAGWFAHPIAGFILFFVGAGLALLSMKKYELVARFRATDETGVQPVSLARSNSSNDFRLFEQTAATVTAELA